MTQWKARLALLSANAVVIAMTLAGVGLFVGECRDFRARGKADTAPVVAPPTKIEQKAEPKVLPCRDVQAIEPGAKARQKLAEKYHRPDLAQKSSQAELARPVKSPDFDKPAAPPAEILGERMLHPMPTGGTALVTLEPDGRVELTVVANPERLFEWRTTYEAGALYGIGQEGDTRARAWVAAEPLRFARLHLRIEAGADLRAGTTDPYIQAGVVWRSR